MGNAWLEVSENKDLDAAQNLLRKLHQQATLLIPQEKPKAPYRHGKCELHEGRNQCTLLPVLSPHPQFWSQHLREQILLKGSLKDLETSQVRDQKSCPCTRTGKETAFKRPWYALLINKLIRLHLSRLQLKDTLVVTLASKHQCNDCLYPTSGPQFHSQNNGKGRLDSIIFTIFLLDF